MKPAAATLLLALVVAAAAVAPSPSDAARLDDASAGHHRHGPRWRDHHHGGSRSPLAGLTECVAVCGSGVTGCMLDCYKPSLGLDPVQLPVCLLKCTNDAMICGSSCSTNL
ncbi:uncharacterized protein C2845_PM07G33660 [Panicum miliaceum]|uniref:Uncharacterized protein n=1 Tax=Panicum miliaceum TaxID=4540 RepID=A0A3L6SIG6_PANMI|nr:uncharacterized protein C2845_PM07G33660 [Panicum miliaceum]